MPRRPHYAITPQETLRHFGARRTLLLIGLKGLKIRSVVVIARDPMAQPQRADGTVSIRRARAEDDQLFETAGFNRQMLTQKLDEGPGWLCVAGGRLLAWNFLGTKESVIAGWLRLRSAKPSAIWGTGTWVDRSQRGAGLASQLRRCAGDWCAAEGYDELLGWIELTNYSSRRASQKLGAREIGRITFVRRFGLALVYDGRRLRLGRWSGASPLLLSVDDLRRDRDATGRRDVAMHDDR